MKRVLLTGASGFVGRHCPPYLLEHGYEVHATARGGRPPDMPGVTWHSCDLLDPGQVRGLIAAIRPSHLLHLAWYAVPGRYWTSLENLRWVEGSLALLRFFSENGGQRAVIAGSCAEYDWDYPTEPQAPRPATGSKTSVDQQNIIEGICGAQHYGYCSEALTPIRPTTLYGQSKVALGILLRGMAAQTGLSAAWARLFLLYGPHEPAARLIPSVIDALLAGKPAHCSSGEQFRDYLYVKDAAAALAALLDSDLPDAVNLGSGIPIRVREIVTRIATFLNGESLLRLGELPLRAGDPDLLVADTRLLNQRLGWYPAYSLDRGLEETIAWRKKAAHGGNAS
uniref:Nucleoside-diphosphate-sugar epimerase n=1 Tax=Candidatus Kentrum sp. FM TaxID=2126340 RepID=A0A450T374_9GAMM|nr:MAG: Nucleoside-diphosphate-sugar epimerase [Candidatus Kentron sp. FM]VFJ60929.1 MAG: Nucleoside-diphosphate-sugar epimerase [Candidatus Kentron sp. FM]VFK12183.1 MAG: Nucleoside-diphosphate-sugar epimerase [Candidatus Kentron sp. FM]